MGMHIIDYLLVQTHAHRDINTQMRACFVARVFCRLPAPQPPGDGSGVDCSELANFARDFPTEFC